MHLYMHVCIYLLICVPKFLSRNTYVFIYLMYFAGPRNGDGPGGVCVSVCISERRARAFAFVYVRVCVCVYVRF